MKATTCKILSLAALVAVMASCSKDEGLVTPVAGPPQQVDQPATPQTPSAPPTPNVPQETPVPGRLREMRYSQIDFSSFDYNAEGKLIRFRNQYQSSPDYITKFDHTVSYNADGKVSEIRSENNSFQFEYIGHSIIMVKELDKLGRPLKKYSIKLNGYQQPVEVVGWKVSLDGNESPYERIRMAYDAGQNLVWWEQSYFADSLNAFQVSSVVELSKFDQKPYVQHSLSFGPMYRLFPMFKNNPGQKQIKTGKGQLTGPIETYGYTYGEDDFAIERTTYYTYDKPVQPLTVRFKY